MLITRDRNCPSVILWSIGNEEPNELTERGKRIAQSMKATVKKPDNSRPVTAALCRDPGVGYMTEVMDVIGINYQLNTDEKTHEKFSDIPIFESKCCATGTTRDWYTDDEPVRGYINAHDHDLVIERYF